jgi:integrase
MNFCSAMAKTARPRTLGIYTENVDRAAGLPETFRSYDARHTAATLLLQDKTSPKVVSERLGHASIDVTLDVYGHVLPGMQEEVTERLDKLIFGELSVRRILLANSRNEPFGS